MMARDLAQARGALTLQLSGGLAPRVAARSLSKEMQDSINDPKNAPFVLYAADLPTQDRIKLQAASILNANDIAASVSAQERSDLAQLIDDECRQNALLSRVLARPATGETGKFCATSIRASLKDVSKIMEHLSPFSQADAELPKDHARLSAAAEMALSHVSRAND